MNKKYIRFVVAVLFIAILTNTCAFASEHTKKKFVHDIEVSNGLFSFVLPRKLKKAFVVKKRNNGIFIYDKKSKKEGFGGFAFGVQAFKSPSDYAMMPGGTKVGELVNKKGNLYDIVLSHPTDVQYNYVDGESKTYSVLYEWGDTPEKDIRGKRGYTYMHRQGTDGSKMYQKVLKKHITAIKEKWDSTKLEKENMSYMYNVIAASDRDPMEVIGYTYYDVNADGIEELIIGEIAEGEWQGIIYDLYTMVNRKPQHVLSGGERNRYFVTDDEFICNEYSSGAKESGWLIYVLVENSTELFPQVGFKYDGYKDEKNPWFITYNIDKDEWESVSEETFNERKEVFDRYERFNFKPLSSLIEKAE